jgi:hypothetical protein
LKWKKWNGRNDVIKPWWFKFTNSFFLDDKFYGFSDKEKLFFIYLLCEASQQKKDGQLMLNFDHAFRLVSINECDAILCLKKLKSFQVVSVNLARSRPESERDLNVIPPDSVLQIRREEKRRENTYAQPSGRASNFDFERIYQSYPLKRGKSVGLQICRSKIKTDEDYSNLELAVANYAKEVVGRDKNFIMYFSTFMSKDRWTEWVVVEPENNKKQETIILTPEE